jgi:LacI family transcriptional regulator
MFDKISKLSKCSKIIIDDQRQCRSAFDGCRKIAHIRGPLNPQNAIDRFMDIKA